MDSNDKVWVLMVRTDYASLTPTSVTTFKEGIRYQVPRHIADAFFSRKSARSDRAHRTPADQPKRTR